MWEATPAAQAGLPNYRIARVPARSRLRLILLSSAHEGVNLHFWKGRSVPCTGANCEACINGLKPRWKGYVLAQDAGSKRVAILEFTERAYQAVAEATKKFGSLRGTVLDAYRINNKPNGPMTLEFHDERKDQLTLPDETDLRGMLTRMWEVNEKQLGLFKQNDDVEPEKFYAG